MSKLFCAKTFFWTAHSFAKMLWLHGTWATYLVLSSSIRVTVSAFHIEFQRRLGWCGERRATRLQEHLFDVDPQQLLH